MEPESILQIHAEVAIALGGFASVAAVLGRPLGEIRRQRFLALLFLALTQVLSCLIPMLLGQLGLAPALLWRVATLLSLAIASAVIVGTVVIPVARIGRVNSWVFGPTVTRLLDVVSSLSVIVLVLNLVGFPWSPGFPLYYTSLLLAFVVGFVIFADSVLLEGSGGSPAVRGG